MSHLKTISNSKHSTTIHPSTINPNRLARQVADNAYSAQYLLGSSIHQMFDIKHQPMLLHPKHRTECNMCIEPLVTIHQTHAYHSLPYAFEYIISKPVRCAMFIIAFSTHPVFSLAYTLRHTKPEYTNTTSIHHFGVNK